MEKQTIQNILEDMVLKELKDSWYLTTQDVIDLFAKYCENDEDNEDLEEILDIVLNSKKYNHITCQNGDGYIFGTKKKQIVDFIKYADISKNDPVWREFIYCDDSWEDNLSLIYWGEK